MRGAGGRFLNAEEARRVLEERKASEVAKQETDGDGSSCSCVDGDLQRGREHDGDQPKSTEKEVEGCGESGVESGVETQDASQQSSPRKEDRSRDLDGRGYRGDAAQRGESLRGSSCCSANADSDCEAPSKRARRSGPVP